MFIICIHQINLPSSQLVTRSGAVRGQLYKFKSILNPSSSQKEVFDTLARPLVNDLLKGKNGLLFAYGVTGSGKTYTMQVGYKYCQSGSLKFSPFFHSYMFCRMKHA